ncbi:hypothetical protein PFISCL1PPCAC_9083, partial [Pristionchus fissidentatus]
RNTPVSNPARVTPASPEMRLTLLLLAALIGAALAGQGYLFPQSACRVHCHNGGACAYDTDDPQIHSCICLVGVYEGDRCEHLVPGAVDPAAAATTTTTTTTTTARPTQPPTPSAYELELKRREEQRVRHMEERRKHEEERKRMEEERRRIMEERAKQEEARKQEMATRGREEETRRRVAEEEQRRHADEERRREVDRRLEAERVEQQRRRQEQEKEERRRIEEERREKESANNEEHSPDTPAHKLDYEEYEDSLDGERLEEVPEDRNTVDEEEEDIDHVEAAEMEKQKEAEEEDDEDEEDDVTPEPTTAVTYEMEQHDDYVTSTTPTLENDAKHDDSKMSGEDNDYWDHTPLHPDIDDEGNKELPPLPGSSTEDVVRGTQIDQKGRAIGGVAPLDEDDEDE